MYKKYFALRYIVTGSNLLTNSSGNAGAITTSSSACDLELVIIFGHYVQGYQLAGSTAIDLVNVDESAIASCESDTMRSCVWGLVERNLI
jgi:hypothetical protein